MRSLVTPKWVLSHLFVLAMVVVMVNLGFWQLDRLDERRADNDAVQAAAAQQPIESLLEAVVDPPDHTAATVEGTYRAQDSFLVANRTFNTQAGSWLATPLELADGRLVVVARGWVPRLWVAGDDQRAVDTPSGTVTVVGRVFDSVGGGRLGTGTEDYAEVSRMDLATVEEATGLEVVDLWVQLESQTPATGDLPVPVPPPVLDDGPHLSYAFQWFFFSFGTIVVYGLILRRRLGQQ